MILASTILAALSFEPGPLVCDAFDGGAIIPATFTRIIDGDTFEFIVHLPFGVHVDQTIRLEGIDTPEMRGLQAKDGQRAKEFVETWAASYPNVVIRDTGRTTFGRAVSTVCPMGGGKCLTESLREAGHFKINEKLGR
jgi:endonuclease YncB( thermonuclease family)